jgi:hypothetical protein
MESENEVQKLDAVLVLALKCRHVFKEQEQEQEREQEQEHKKCDNDLRHLVKQKIGPECDSFAQEYPHLFAFMCSSTTSDENVIKMQKTIEVKKQVIRGIISEEVGKQLILSDLN